MIDLRTEEPATKKKAMEGIIASYVIAQGGNKKRINEKLPILENYLKRKRIADISRDKLLKKALKQKAMFDSVERKARISAKLFTSDVKPRKAKYRRGSEFCGECKMFKNYSKECPYCGRLEITK